MEISKELKKELDGMITVYRPVNKWNEEREDALRYLYAKTSVTEIYRIFKIKYPDIPWTQSAIKCRIGKLGLTKE